MCGKERRGEAMSDKVRLFVELSDEVSVALGMIKAKTRMSKRKIVEEALLDYIAKQGINVVQPKTWEE